MNATETGAGARIVRLAIGGDVYFPIVRDGSVLGPEQVAELVATSAPAVGRRFLAILADESMPRERGTMPLALDRFTPTKAVPLTYGDSVYTIGCLEGLAVIPAGCTFAQTDGPCLVGDGRLYPNALAAIVWPAIQRGLLRGLCVEVVGEPEGDRLVVQDVTRVTLGGRENNCLPNARIVDVLADE